MELTGGLNVWALPLAAVVSFVFGAAWYAALSRPWRAASRIDATTAATSPPPAMLAATFLAQLVMAGLLAQLLLNLRLAGFQVSAASGLAAAAVLWFGFILMPLLVNNMYQRAPLMLSIIDGAHWLGVMVLQGAVLGALALK